MTDLFLFMRYGPGDWEFRVLDFKIQRLPPQYGNGGIGIFRADPYIQPNLYTRVL